MRTLGISLLFLPIAPLTYSVWAISNWLSSTYQNVQGATDKIIIWTLIITLLLLTTYFFTAIWGWRVIVQKKPQAAVFAGGTFLVLWGYLLYRATTIAIGYITQNQPSNPLVDSGLMLVSVIGAMQTFARKTVTRPDRRWSQVLPFLVFAFGSVYAVAQFYFILQVPITRIDLSIIVNVTVLAAGIFTMMFLIRRHLVSVELNAYKAKMAGQFPGESSPDAVKPHHLLFRFPWKKAAKAPEPKRRERVQEETPNPQVADPYEAPAEPIEAPSDPNEEATEANDQDY